MPLRVQQLVRAQQSFAFRQPWSLLRAAVACNHAAWSTWTRLLAACKTLEITYPSKWICYKSKTCRRGVNATSGYLFAPPYRGIHRPRLGKQKQSGRGAGSSALVASSAHRKNNNKSQQSLALTERAAKQCDLQAAGQETSSQKQLVAPARPSSDWQAGSKQSKQTSPKNKQVAPARPQMTPCDTNPHRAPKAP